MDPLVSVITTVYNCERYIDVSLRSILSQEFTDFELIIANDGSTDKTWEIATSFSDSRIIFCNDSENRRIPFRRNQAIEKARGKYIAIHDGDDESLPIRLRMEVEWMEHYDNTFCVGSHAIKIDTDGNFQGFMAYPPKSHNEIVRKLLQGFNPLIDPSTLFKKKDFIELGGYTLDDNIYTVPDMDLWARAILAEKQFCNLPIPLIRYRINPEGVTRKHKQEMIAAHKKVVHKFVQDLIAHDKQKYEERIRRYD